MGVRGLTTFIKNQEKKYLKDYKLHGCKVLLDGNSVASNLFIWSNIESAFGGDYDKYAKYVKEFFKILQKCEIIPLVIFDGGYEERKLRTVYSRMKEKFKSVRQAQPLTGSLNFPLFMRIVFREVLVELKIPFAQSDFEADDELAALARQMQCPVLSYDSDFYIYDVLYIPLPTLCLEPIAFNSMVGKENSKSKYYLECKIYSLDIFIESFGGLDKSMLPLLAALLGNDYIKRSVFKAFYTNLKIPKGKSSPLQRRIKAVMQWLRNETFESAVLKILGRMKRHSRRRVMRQLRKIVNGYLQCTSVLNDYLVVSDVTSSMCSNMSASPRESTHIDSNIICVIDNIDENLETVDERVESFLNDSSDFGNESVPGSEDSSDETDCEEGSEDGFVLENASKITTTSFEPERNENSDSDIPDWILKCARKGKIQSCVIDILTLKQYFFPPQVEDHSFPASHFISLKILSAIVGLLLDDSDRLVKYWTRNGSHLDWFTVEPIYETASLKFPPCNRILDTSVSVRTASLLEIVEVEIDLSVIPEEWHLFLIAVVYWLKNMKQPVVTESHLHTMVMCLVAIFTIDFHIGVHRNKQTFTRKYKNFVNKIIESRNKEKKAKENSASSIIDINIRDNKDEHIVPKQKLANVSHDDCVLIFETVVTYHHLSEQIKIKPKIFCLTTVHAFSQFQSSLFHIIVLNSVLGFPLKEPVVSHLYSGTFAYNIFQNFSKRNNITAYIDTLFRSSPSLLSLYKSLICLLENLLSEVDLHKKSLKVHKKKKKLCMQTKMVDNSNSDGEEENAEVYLDENNIFSRLSLTTT